MAERLSSEPDRYEAHPQPTPPGPASDTAGAPAPACDPEVTAWLKKLGFEQHEGRFAESGVSMEHVKRLTEEDLRELGVAKAGHRKALLDAVEREWRKRSLREKARDLGLRGFLDAIVLVSTVIVTVISYLALRDARAERAVSRAAIGEMRRQTGVMQRQTALSIRPAVVPDLEGDRADVGFFYLPPLSYVGGAPDGGGWPVPYESDFSAPGPGVRAGRFIRLRNLGQAVALDVEVKYRLPDYLKAWVERARAALPSDRESRGAVAPYLSADSIAHYAQRSLTPHGPQYPRGDLIIQRTSYPAAFVGVDQELWAPFPTAAAQCMEAGNNFTHAVARLPLAVQSALQGITGGTCYPVGVIVTFYDLAGDVYEVNYRLEQVGLAFREDDPREHRKRYALRRLSE